MKKILTKSLILVILVTILLGAFSVIANAASQPEDIESNDPNLLLNSTTGSLTIIKNDYTKDPDNPTVVSGTVFDIYKVDDESESLTLPEGNTTASATTNAEGKAVFSNLALGRYLVVERTGTNTSAGKISNFLVDVPTTLNGTTLTYDVEVTPKNTTSFGSVKLTNLGRTSAGTAALSGSTFQLQVKKAGVWTNVENALLTTNDSGEIEVVGLEEAEYRFIHVSVPEGYILDNATVYGFSVESDADGNILAVDDIEVITDKPSLTKEVTSSLVNNSVKLGDTVSYKLTVDLVPSTLDRLTTFKVTDVFPTGLTFNPDSLSVTGTRTPKVMPAISYTPVFDENTKTLTITFSDTVYENIIITYNTTVNEDILADAAGMKNQATLTYSTIVETDYDNTANAKATVNVDKDVTVYTGGFWIEKRAEKADGAPLQGAKFRIAASEKDAKDGKYLTDYNNNVIEIVSDANGKASYKGLEYGTYWLVEVEAPTYVEDGTTKQYNLLRKPQEITVDANSYTSDAPGAVIINKTGFQLPETGGMGTLFLILLGLIFVVIGYRIMNQKPKKRN